ncbi:hypothetical protein [Oricola sp.]|uniref:hypothetical protein n=1 Tax=Oricola sp. TaxID=1979950 RepID=UPI003BA9E646
MTRLAKAALLSAAVTIAATAPATAVDYEINTDVDFPSVVFIDFDPATMPVVLEAPKVSSLSVIGGGQSASPDQQADAPKSEESRTSEEAGERKSASFNDRAESRLEELSRPGSTEFEDRLIDREIEDRFLEEVELRR